MTGHEAELVDPDPVMRAHDRAIFAMVAETHPGVIRTINLLITELSDLDNLPTDLRRALGDHLRRVGDTVIRQADWAAGGGSSRA